jgi:hypothetical protein
VRSIISTVYFLRSITYIVRRTNRRIGQLSSVCFPRGDILLASHGEIDRIDHDGIPRSRLVGNTLRRLSRGIAPITEQTLVVG